MIRPIKIAVLGAGYMGQNHVKILSSLPDVNLTSICDIDSAKTRMLAKQYQINEYQNIDSLIASEKLDAITICLPTTLHYETAILTIKKGIPTFIEKPISATVKEAENLVAIAKRYQVPVMVGHIERFNPVVNEIKLRLKAGELGRIIKIHTQRFSPPTQTKQDVSVIVDLATHDIDVMKYLLNEIAVRVYAETTHRVHKKEDLMTSILRFKNGTIGVIEVSWLHPAKTRNLSILGEHGMYSANYITQELLFYRQNSELFKNNFDPLSTFTKADVVKIAFQSKEPLYLELKAFIEALRNKTDMPITANDGLYAIKLAEKITLASNTFSVLN